MQTIGLPVLRPLCYLQKNKDCNEHTILQVANRAQERPATCLHTPQPATTVQNSVHCFAWQSMQERMALRGVCCFKPDQSCYMQCSLQSAATNQNSVSFKPATCCNTSKQSLLLGACFCRNDCNAPAIKPANCRNNSEQCLLLGARSHKKKNRISTLLDERQALSLAFITAVMDGSA